MPQVLIVENDAHHLLTITALLKEMDITPKRNTTGGAVIRQANSMQPDLIILELDLTDCDPFALCQEIHAQPALACTPILAVGSPGWKHFQEKLRSTGFAGFVAKPLPRKHFQQTVRQLLEGRSAWSRSPV
jgi:two-component system cell cycle response regulator DivK